MSVITGSCICCCGDGALGLVGACRMGCVCRGALGAAGLACGFGEGVFVIGCVLGMDLVVVVVGVAIIVVVVVVNFREGLATDSSMGGEGRLGGGDPFVFLALARLLKIFLGLDFSGLLVGVPGPLLLPPEDVKVVFSATFRACLALELDLYSV
jgi:hypothetical protein